MLHQHLDVCTAVKHVGTEQEKQYTWPANTGQVSPLRYLYDGTSCPACLKEFHVPYKVLQHLRTAHGCRCTPEKSRTCFRSQRWVWALQTTRWLKRSTTGSFHGSKLLDHVFHQTGTMVRRISWATTSILQSTLCHSWMNLPLCALPA